MGCCYSQEARSFFFSSLNSSRKLVVDNSEFVMKGWNYSSNYLDGASTNPWYVETSQLPYDLADIKAAGMNVVKIYMDENNAASHLAALDVVASYGLKALLLDFVTYGTDYSVATGSANRTAKINAFTTAITNLKSHPAIIGWGFGNENNLNLGSTSAADWYSLVNAACAAGKAIDNTRFYFTVDGELGTFPGDASLTNVDVIGANIYRGTTFTGSSNLRTDVIHKTTKPFFLSEFGRKRADNIDANQQTQADEVVSLIQEADSYYPYIVGWDHFKFTHTRTTQTGDEFWEATAPLSQGTYQSRTKFKLYDSIKSYLTNK